MKYSFVTTWRLKTPLQSAWNAIYLSEQWPQWWDRVISVQEIEKGDEQGIGSIRIYKLRSPMLYTLSFRMQLTDRVEYKLLSGIATGDLVGTGSWQFEADGEITTIRCYWDVTTSISWMNKLSFLLKPIFKLNHSIVMKQGGKCLARKLNAEIISLS
ncbi:MAG: SRPBCC family protein [Bacteroidetes bacterium]|nr:SRPBCC family protein [Bacteroidota bacterium]